MFYFTMKTAVTKKFDGQTVVVIATGPSITEEQIEIVKLASHFSLIKVMTINNAYQVAPFTDIQIACNDNWWEHYLANDPLLRKLKADCWTRYKHIAEEHEINYIDSIVKEGLSRDPSMIHINKGSGPMAINFATLYGFKKILLIGHDMKFAKDYSGREKKIGSTPRHYFGEYPKSMQHFPQSQNSVDKNGVIIGLIDAYEKMVNDLINMNVDVVNCTPNTALNCFRKSTLESEL